MDAKDGLQAGHKRSRRTRNRRNNNSNPLDRSPLPPSFVPSTTVVLPASTTSVDATARRMAAPLVAMTVVGLLGSLVVLLSDTGGSSRLRLSATRWGLPNSPLLRRDAGPPGQGATTDVLLAPYVDSQWTRRTEADDDDNDNEEEPPLPPPLIENVASLTDPPSDYAHDTPLFWHIPKAGGTAVENLYASCFGLVVANEVGCNVRVRDCTEDESLEVFEPWSQHGNSMRVINVDTTTPEGLQRAHALHLAESGLADVIFTSYLPEAVSIVFNPVNRARVFTVLRHPIERAVSMFYYLQEANWETTYSPETKGWTVEQYAQSDKVDRDWMVRMLVGKRGEEIYEKDLELAKAILREKVLIGLISRMEESVYRFDRYLGLGDSSGGGSSEHEQCTDDILGGKGGGTNSHSHPKVEPGSDGWKALERANYFDLRLYDYAVALFEEQAGLFDDEEEDAT